MTSRRLLGRFWTALAMTMVALASACSSDDSPSTPTSATPQQTSTVAAPTLTGVTLAGTQSFTARDTVAQFALTAGYSDGSISDESRAATGPPTTRT